MNKPCGNCGHVHTEVPKNARPWIDDEMKLVSKDHIVGWFWECKCGSTMFKKEVSSENQNRKAS